MRNGGRLHPVDREMSASSGEGIETRWPRSPGWMPSAPCDHPHHIFRQAVMDQQAVSCDCGPLLVTDCVIVCLIRLHAEGGQIGVAVMYVPVAVESIGRES